MAIAAAGTPVLQAGDRRRLSWHSNAVLRSLLAAGYSGYSTMT
jgi:nicotinic acid phosphoribosyltransferase